MKRSALLAVLAVVLSAACAFGGVQDFGKFTLDIPKGWIATRKDWAEKELGMTVKITKKDKSSSMSVSFATRDKNAIEDLVVDWAHMEDDSSEPKLTDDGYYMFTFRNESRKKATCYVMEVGEMYLCVEMTGRDVKVMKAIRDSFKAK